MHTLSDRSCWANDVPRHAGPLRSLLQTLFAGARGVESAPLGFHGGRAEVVRAAWSAFLGHAPWAARENGEAICQDLDALLTASLADLYPPAACSTNLGGDLRRPQRGAADADAEAHPFRSPGEARLAAWLDRTCAVMCGIDPLALEIVEWRLAGADCREMAERLGLGLRFVQRIVADLRAAWRDESTCRHSRSA
jgi:hypothetical protein